MSRVSKMQYVIFEHVRYEFVSVTTNYATFTVVIVVLKDQEELSTVHVNGTACIQNL